ncbi:hypothetical protein SODALDRAFT_356144 [Sodiomyces alkalinus F11]|uniref:Uncharacterized protein n=1 Tax=Sodiomyces alkalinus (strain CBS 110278 / VKM F-3762 / F11) TaxID=1314773 RepID=A0A3N2Q0G9_SODAK|nr:hypothetical protein SODALDRAFT_356144 [Sodiomyces alkalinus F11]ROT40188.1 hypothetical protein SODALDRAFT_356144 [Sodiomyces alkalinus F11]
MAQFTASDECGVISSLTPSTNNYPQPSNRNPQRRLPLAIQRRNQWTYLAMLPLNNQSSPRIGAMQGSNTRIPRNEHPKSEENSQIVFRRVAGNVLFGVASSIVACFHTSSCEELIGYLTLQQVRLRLLSCCKANRATIKSSLWFMVLVYRPWRPGAD